MRSHTQADADGNGKVSDTEFKNALLQSPGLSDDDIGKIYLSSKTTDDSTDEKAQTFNATYGPAGVTDYLYLQYLERAYHTAEANRKIAAGEGGNPDGSFNKSDLVNALNYMDRSSSSCTACPAAASCRGSSGGSARRESPPSQNRRHPGQRSVRRPCPP